MSAPLLKDTVDIIWEYLSKKDTVQKIKEVLKQKTLWINKGIFLLERHCAVEKCRKFSYERHCGLNTGRFVFERFCGYIKESLSIERHCNEN